MAKSPIEVLLIENDLAYAEKIGEMLAESRREKFSTKHTRRLAEGIDQLRNDEFDVVLVDLELPDSRGLETAVVVREQSKSAPVIALIAPDDEDAVEITITSQDYLLKGEVSSERLLRSIGYAIDRQRDTERIRAEDALHKSEIHYRTLFESIDEGFCVCEVIFDDYGKAVDYRIIEVNPSFEEKTGMV